MSVVIRVDPNSSVDQILANAAQAIKFVNDNNEWNTWADRITVGLTN